MPQDYYQTLGISRDATDKEIKRAYRKLARKYHPDINDSAETEDKFKEINQAYEVLSDSQKRAAYDRLGHAAFNQNASHAGQGGYDYQNMGFDFGGFSDPFDIFEQFFGSRSPFGFNAEGSRASAKQAGRDLAHSLKISFAEAVKGAKKEITYQRLQPCPACDGSGAAPGSKPTNCPTCQGRGRVQQRTNSFLGQIATVTVCPECQGQGEIIREPCSACQGKGRKAGQENIEIKIPPGIEAGQKLRFPGKGDSGARGSIAGDLYIDVQVESPTAFKRRGADIHLELPISFSQAALGDQAEIPTVDPEAENGLGKTTIKIPAGIQSGTQIKLSGQGMPQVNRRQRGDQLVKIKVHTPEKLTPKQKEVFQELKEVEGQTPRLWEKIFG